MKNLLFILLLAGTGAQAQITKGVTEIYSTDLETNGIQRVLICPDTGINWVTGQNANRVSQLRITQPDCEYFETFTDWEGKIIGKKDCAHSWVYAEWQDVNAASMGVIDIYCPCGCPQSENQARICSECLRHETRVRSYGFRDVERKESEYVRLKKKIKE